MQILNRKSIIKSIAILMLCLFVFSFISKFAFAADEATTPATGPASEISKSVFGDKMNEEEDTNYFEKTLAGVIVSITDFLLDVIKLKDFNALIFVDTDKTDLVYGTFTKPVFTVIGTFYNSFVDVAGNFLVVAIIAWGYIILFRSLDPISRNSASEILQSILIFMVCLYYGFYIFDTIFGFNSLFISFAADGLQKSTGWNVHELSVLDIFQRETTSLPKALLLLIVVASLGVMNYQYALRMCTLLFLMSYFPVTAYTSIFPASHKSLDTWFREFFAQVFMQFGHALAYALFLAVLAKDANFWILIAFILGMPTISSLVRIGFGASNGGGSGVGGAVKGMLGAGSLMAAQALINGPKGMTKPNFQDGAKQVVEGIGGAGASATSAMGHQGFGITPGSSMPSSSGGLGAAFSSIGNDLRQMGSGSNNGSLGSYAAKAAGSVFKGSAAATGFMVASAMTGDVGAGLAGAKLSHASATKVAQRMPSAVRGISTVGSNAWKSYKGDPALNKIQGQTSMTPKEMPLGLPSGSQVLALPPSSTPPQMTLPGIQTGNLSNNAGVIQNQVPSHSQNLSSHIGNTPSSNSKGSAGVGTASTSTQSRGTNVNSSTINSATPTRVTNSTKPSVSNSQSVKPSSSNVTRSASSGAIPVVNNSGSTGNISSNTVSSGGTNSSGTIASSNVVQNPTPAQATNSSSPRVDFVRQKSANRGISQGRTTSNTVDIKPVNVNQVPAPNFNQSNVVNNQNNSNIVQNHSNNTSNSK